jgi:hypothetical protein
LQAILLYPGPRGGETVERRHFVILDSLPDTDPAGEQEHCNGLLKAANELGADETGFAGAGLYYPWIAVPRFVPPGEPPGVGEGVDTHMVPPCGHIAGVYARTDEAAGLRKAPGNEVLYGVIDLQSQISDNDQGSFFVLEKGEPPPGLKKGQPPLGAVNCLRAFPGRGIRIWGARTLAADPAWRYINVRRLFLSAIRWI